MPATTVESWRNRQVDWWKEEAARFRSGGQGFSKLHLATTCEQIAADTQLGKYDPPAPRKG